MLRILLVLAAVIAAIVIIAILALRTASAREFARQQLVRTLTEQGYYVELESTDYSLMRPSVTLNDLTITPEKDRDLPPLAKAERLRLRLELLPLLAGNYVINEAVVENPHIHIVKVSDERSNLPDFSEERDEGEESRSVALEDLQVIGGSLTVDDRQNDLHLSLPGWRFTVSGNRDTFLANVRLETTSAGTAAFKGRAISIQKLVLDGLAHQNGMEVRSFQVAAMGTEISASGSVKEFANPAAEVKGNARVSLEPLVKFSRAGMFASGELRGPFTVSGPLSEPVVNATLGGTGLVIDRFHDIALDADAILQNKADLIRFRSLKISSPLVQFDGHGQMTLVKSGSSALQGQVRNADLEALSAAFKAPVGFASRGAGNVTINWPGTNFALARVRASLNLISTRPAPEEKILPVSGPIALVYERGAISFSSNALQTLAARSNMRVTLAPAGTISGQVRGSTAESDLMLGNLRAFLGRKDPLIPANVAGPAQQ